MKVRFHFNMILVLGILCTGIEAASDDAKASMEMLNAPLSNTPVHIQIEGQTDCLDAEAVTGRLEAVLRPYEDAPLLSVAVVEAPAIGGRAVTLRVMMLETGEIVLERSFTFNEADCLRAHQVLQVVLEQFLSGFPIAEWKAENKPVVSPPPPQPAVQIKEVVVQRGTLVASWLVSLGLAFRFPSPNGALELGCGPDVGTEKNGFVGIVSARVGYPKILENGRYIETYALLGLGWRAALTRRFRLRLLLKAGGLYVVGYGFDRNLSGWLPWIEAQVILAWRVGKSSIGIELGGSPLQYSVSMSDGERLPLGFLHAGLHWSIPMSILKKNEES